MEDSEQHGPPGNKVKLSSFSSSVKEGLEQPCIELEGETDVSELIAGSQDEFLKSIEDVEAKIELDPYLASQKKPSLGKTEAEQKLKARLRSRPH